jgi:hypothetical protein
VAERPVITYKETLRAQKSNVVFEQVSEPAE